MVSKWLFVIALGAVSSIAAATTPISYAECVARVPSRSDDAAAWNAAMLRCREMQSIADRAKENLASAKAAKAKSEWASRPKEVHIGMTRNEVLRTQWGKPRSINTTTTAGGSREQWVYGGHNYLYFQDGILTAIQN